MPSAGGSAKTKDRESDLARVNNEKNATIERAFRQDCLRRQQVAQRGETRGPDNRWAWIDGVRLTAVPVAFALKPLRLQERQRDIKARCRQYLGHHGVLSVAHEGICFKLMFDLS